MGKRGPRAFPAEGGGGPSQLPGDWLRRYALIESINERQWAQSIFGRGASGRAFCNVLFVKADDKYWPRSFAFARTYVTQAHSSVRTTAVMHARASIHAHAGYTHKPGVSTALVNYIGTTVSPALFIVRYRHKLLSVRLVTSRFVTSTTTVGRWGLVAPT